MLRLLVLLLLLANGAYFAWSQGLLASWGVAPLQQAEPQRLTQQIRPEAMRIASAEEAKRIETTPASKAPECLQAGPLDEAQATALKAALEPWPGGSWTIEASVEPARWIVYMGKYLTVENVNRKKAELRQLGISFESLSNPSLELGLSLGGFASQADATQQLNALAQRGVRTAKVVQERAEVKGQLLKLPAVDEALRPRLDELKPALGAANLRACR
ncbi:MAG: SPOR domain-containing protein [Burkholderiales bacterium]|nr:SPOR domain-containing protein [Burkholderiales bacterium]